MYKKILVPLDGSKLAESSLSHMEELARGCGTEEVILISVTEHIKGYKPEFATGQPIGLGYSQPVIKIPVRVGKMQKQAEKYLDRIARKLKIKGVKVRTEVLIGNPAEEIALFAENSGADIIVMSSHGRSGPSRWAFGSVAEKVLWSSCVPVLTIKAPGCVIGI